LNEHSSTISKGWCLSCEVRAAGWHHHYSVRNGLPGLRFGETK